MTSVQSAALSVLVAEDEDGIRQLVVHWLTCQGHQVVAVASASEAVPYLRSQAFDLVVTDIVMPDGDGLELIAALRKQQPAARIVAISGGGVYMPGTDCLRIACGLGAHAAVKKPFNREQLQDALARALE